MGMRLVHKVSSLKGVMREKKLRRQEWKERSVMGGMMGMIGCTSTVSNMHGSFTSGTPPPNSDRIIGPISNHTYLTKPCSSFEVFFHTFQGKIIVFQQSTIISTTAAAKGGESA